VIRSALRRNACTCPGLRGLDRIDTVIQDETDKKGGIEIPPDARPIDELVIPLRRLFRVRAIMRSVRRQSSHLMAVEGRETLKPQTKPNRKEENEDGIAPGKKHQK
jgi:hypothetical protein